LHIHKFFAIIGWEIIVFLAAGIVAAIIKEKDKIFATQRGYGDFKDGWEFPGGIIESGEPIDQALRREIREESGVEVEVTGFVGVCKNVERNIVNMDFRCRYVGGELTTSDESPQVGWFTREQAVEMITDELIKKRFLNMLDGDGKAHIFSFIKEPFSVVSEMILPV